MVLNLMPMNLRNEPTTSLRRNFSWTVAGNFFFSACSWAILSLLAKIGTPEMVGQYSLAVAVVVPILTFAQLQLRAIQATDIRHAYLFQHYFGLRVVATSLAFILILVLALNGAYSPTIGALLLLVGLTESVESLSDIFYGLFQRQERMDRIAVSMAVRGALSLLGMAAGLALSRDVVWGVFGIAAGRLVTLLLYDIPRGVATVSAEEKVRPSLAYGLLKGLFILALPMGLTLMINALSGNLPRYFIAGFLGERELGIFAASASIMGISQTVIGALGQSASPRLARFYAEGRSHDYWQLMRRLVLITALTGIAAVLVGILAGKEILRLLFRAEYAEDPQLLVWLLAGGAVANMKMWGGVGLTAARLFRIQLPLSVFSALVTLALNWWLIRENGLSGAGHAVLLASSVSAAAVFLVARRMVKFPGREAPRPAQAGIVPGIVDPASIPCATPGGPRD